MLLFLSPFSSYPHFSLPSVTRPLPMDIHVPLAYIAEDHL